MCCMAIIVSSPVLPVNNQNQMLRVSGSITKEWYRAAIKSKGIPLKNATTIMLYSR